MRRASILGLGGLALLVACGSETTNPGTDAGVSLPLLPIAVGNTWTYRVVEGSEVSTKTQTVVEATTFEGKPGYLLETRKGLIREVQSIQAEVDGVLVRYEEKNFKNGELNEWDRYEPSMVRIDSNQLTEGLVYQTEHVKVSIDPDTAIEVSRVTVQNRFTVEETADLVEVPAGRFTAIRVKRQDLADLGRGFKTYWYVPGLGKVKETGGQTEELQSVDLAD